MKGHCERLLQHRAAVLGLDQKPTLNRRTTDFYTVAGAGLSEGTKLSCVTEALVLGFQGEVGLKPERGALQAPNHGGCGWG